MAVIRFDVDLSPDSDVGVKVGTDADFDAVLDLSVCKFCEDTTMRTGVNLEHSM